VATILIIDDAPADMRMMETVLSSARHTVITCINGEGAEALAAQHKPSVIMLDIVMPIRNGYEVLRALKKGEATKNIPVILVSSKGEETDIRWGKRQGAADYVTKPYTPDAVLAAIKPFV
jgi:twitching motility two-component system response regulator PilH